MRKVLMGVLVTVCAAMVLADATPAEARRGGRRNGRSGGSEHGGGDDHGGNNGSHHPNPSLKWGVVRGSVESCDSVEVAGTLVYLEGINAMAKLGPEGTFALYFVPVGTYTLVIERNGEPVDVIPDVEVRKWRYTDVDPVEVCEDADGDGFDASEDCDDSDPNVYPGADEFCNGIDDDCDTDVDEDAVDAVTWYPDGDGDGYGVPGSTVEACDQPEGYANNDADCDDADAAVNPGVDEVCGNGIDDNCDGNVDEGC